MAAAAAAAAAATVAALGGQLRYQRWAAVAKTVPTAKWSEVAFLPASDASCHQSPYHNQCYRRYVNGLAPLSSALV